MGLERVSAFGNKNFAVVVVKVIAAFGLPCEIIAAILRSLDHPRSLLPALLTCRHFYTSFKESHGVEASIIHRQIDPALLPYAVTVAETSRLPLYPRPAASVRSLLDDLYNSPARLASRSLTLPLNTLRSMSRTYEIIQGLAYDFSRRALQQIPSPKETALLKPGVIHSSDDAKNDQDTESEQGTSKEIPAPGATRSPLSPHEQFRFCRAFYRVELFNMLFRGGEFSEEAVRSWFFSRLPPWELEQLGCAHLFLEMEFASGTSLTTHQPFQLSRGICFVHRVITASDYNTKLKLLQSRDEPDGNINHGYYNQGFISALYSVYDAFYEDDGILDERPDEVLRAELAPIRPSRDDWQEKDRDEDPDWGPFHAWLNQHRKNRVATSVMMYEEAWLRARAYVLWDQERMDNEFPDGFGEQAEHPLKYTDEEYDEMIESFDLRSQIWRRGGSGYWSKGDERQREM
ncbi:hypothetical protein VTJ49DRAFT_3364 [Mycothermus thermophilus]|uniref:F-box domain-containing protein n=1 Tax=Humicola insolens TaxID=85995 RepID=A0ABR3V8R7_HUMIN